MVKIELDSLYNEILADNEILEILAFFHTNKWNKLEISEKKDKILKLDRRIMLLIGYKPHQIVFPSLSYLWGECIPEESVILISDKLFSNKHNQYDVLETYFHELRHSFQYQIAEGMNIKGINIAKNEDTLWALNWKHGNYIKSTNPLYDFQPIEMDAHYCGFAVAQKAAMILQNNYGFDPEFRKYVENNTEKIANYFLDDDYSKTRLKQKRQLVLQKYQENSSNMDTTINSANSSDVLSDKEIELIEIGKCIFNKGVSKLKDDELFYLFNPVCNNFLSIEDNVAVANEFIKRTSINKAENQIFVENKNDKYYINNSAFSENIWGKYKMNLLLEKIIIKDTNDFKNCEKYVNDSKFLKEIKNNFYQNQKGEYIALYNDKDEFYKHRFQPSVLFLNKTIFKIERKILDQSNKLCKYKEYEMEPCLRSNLNAEIKQAEMIYNKPISVLYSEVIDEIEEKINQDIQKKRNMVIK